MAPKAKKNANSNVENQPEDEEELLADDVDQQAARDEAMMAKMGDTMARTMSTLMGQMFEQQMSVLRTMVQPASTATSSALTEPSGSAQRILAPAPVNENSERMRVDLLEGGPCPLSLSPESIKKTCW